MRRPHLWPFSIKGPKVERAKGGPPLALLWPKVQFLPAVINSLSQPGREMDGRSQRQRTAPPGQHSARPTNFLDVPAQRLQGNTDGPALMDLSDLQYGARRNSASTPSSQPPQERQCVASSGQSREHGHGQRGRSHHRRLGDSDRRHAARSTSRVPEKRSQMDIQRRQEMLRHNSSSAGRRAAECAAPASASAGLRVSTHPPAAPRAAAKRVRSADERELELQWGEYKHNKPSGYNHTYPHEVNAQVGWDKTQVEHPELFQWNQGWRPSWPHQVSAESFPLEEECTPVGAPDSPPPPPPPDSPPPPPPPPLTTAPNHFPPPTADPPLNAPETVAARRKKRRPPVLPRGTRFPTEEERQEARKTAVASSMAERLPRVIRERLLGGERGKAQVPDEAERQAILARILREIAGPEGDALQNAERALEILQVHAEITDAPDLCLPISSGLAHKLVHQEHTRAVEAAAGGQGGTTAGGALRSAFIWLRDKLNLDIDLDTSVLDAAAPAAAKRKTWRAAAGTLPIAALCQLEFVAFTPGGHPTPPLVFTARSLLAFGWSQSVRVQDMVRTKLITDPYEPHTVMHGSTSVSKDGNPLLLYAPASGILGPYTWYSNHLAEVNTMGRTFPAWAKWWGSGGNVSKCTEYTTPHVQSTKMEIRQALKDILSLPPLSLTGAEIASLSIQGHSCHGTPSDWSRVIGPNPTPYFPTMPGEIFAGFGEPEANALGHWLRDANSPEAQAQQAARPKPGRKARGDAGRTAARLPSDPTLAPGAPALNGEMVLRYTQGESREGERAVQLRLRRRLIEWASRALAHWCATHDTTWCSLPRGRADISVLTAPPASILPSLANAHQ